MRFSELIPAVQMAIGPVILISGVGLILLSITNRFGRVIDRARLVADALRKTAAPGEARYAAQLEILRRRAHVLRRAITFAVISVLLASLLVMTIFITALLHAETAIPVVCLFLASLIFLILSLLAFLHDLNLSLQALELDVAGQ